MKTLTIMAAGAVAITALAPITPAAAQHHRTVVHERVVVRHGPPHHYRPHYRPHRGPGWRHRAGYRTRQVCSWQWRHHHRVRICRTVYR